MANPFKDGLDIQELMKLLYSGFQQYQQFTQNPTQSPLYQNQLQGLLASLEPGEQQAQTNLMDMFRGAGNMSSGAFGAAAGNLQGELQRNRQVTASQLLGQMFPQMTQALQGQTSMARTLPYYGGGGGVSAPNPWEVEKAKDPWNFDVTRGY